MRLVTIGLNHTTAPIEVREKFAVNPDAVPRLLAELRERRLGREAVLLSTCNRVELYAVPGENGLNGELVDWLADTGGVHPRTLGPVVYRYTEREAIRHLFRVASSLDSMVLGEPQILGQVKDAYRLAVANQATGPTLHRVMDRALSVAKRVRTETGIGREAVSVGRAGVELARQVLGDLEKRSALLVGAGAHGKLVAKTLMSHGLGELIVANRTFARASNLAARFGGAAVHLADVPRFLDRVDVVIASTNAGRVLLTREDLSPVMRRRRYKAMVLIDLAVPRNIDPATNQLDGVYRFDVDDLNHVAERGLAARQDEARRAESIILEEVEAFWPVLVTDEVRGQIGQVSRQAEMIRQAELARALAGLEGLAPEQLERIEAMSRAIVKKLLHTPFTSARQLAAHGEGVAAETLLAALGAHIEEDDSGT